MQIRAKLNDVSRAQSGRYLISLEVIEANMGELEKYQDKELALELKQWREKRSLNANALLWACINDITNAFGGDKWNVYLQMLRKYGQYTFIEMPEAALPKFKKMYRECDVVGSRYTDSGDMLQVLCYYGSSTYDTKEFSVLLDGVIDDMKAAGLDTPTSEDIQAALEAWEAENG